MKEICKHGNTKTVKLNKPRPSGRTKVPVDSCIADEIQFLNDCGVLTYGCCCGHGVEKSNCLVDSSSKELLNQLGYRIKEYSHRHTESGIYVILLKSI